jgi:hypothetical protein
VGRNLAIGKGLERGFIVVGGVGETHPSVGLCRDEHQFLVGACFAPDQRLVLSRWTADSSHNCETGT